MAKSYYKFHKKFVENQNKFLNFLSQTRTKVCLCVQQKEHSIKLVEFEKVEMENAQRKKVDKLYKITVCENLIKLSE